MKASLRFTKGCRCAICGCVLDHPNFATATSMTLDHIYPKSGEDRSSYALRYQLACEHCNKLKSNHIPTALLYRIISEFKSLGSRYSELHPVRIENFVQDSLKRTYVVHLSCKGWITISMEDMSCTCHAGIERVLKLLKKRKGPLHTTLKRVCMRPDLEP